MASNAANAMIQSNWAQRHVPAVREIIRQAIRVAKNQRKWRHYGRGEE